VTTITICLNWMAIVITFTVSSRAGEPRWPRLRLDRSARREEDETMSKAADLISTFERWLISLFIRAAR
jgi:hypothetical protein